MANNLLHGWMVVGKMILIFAVLKYFLYKNLQLKAFSNILGKLLSRGYLELLLLIIILIVQI